MAASNFLGASPKSESSLFKAPGNVTFLVQHSSSYGDFLQAYSCEIPLIRGSINTTFRNKKSRIWELF